MGLAAAVAGIAAVGTVAGAVISGNATDSAANTAAQTAANNNQLQSQIYSSNTANEQPFITRGNTAGSNYNALIGLPSSTDPNAASNAFSTFQNSDGYQFRLNQGEQALNTGYAAKGLIQSGAAMKGINAFAQGTASDEFQKYLGNLSNQQGVGLSGANALAGVGTNYANAVSSNNNNAATVAGNADIAGANSVNNSITNGLNAFSAYAGRASSYGGTPTGFTSASLYGS